MTFPRLRLRDEVAGLLDLPWERPLAVWEGDEARFRELPVGPSRHLVRFLVSDGIRITLLMYFPIISLYLVHAFQR